MNRVVFVSLAILCLLSVSSMAGLIRVVKADVGTITINADGSITPSRAPIQRNGDTYTLTGNVNIISDADGIVVERDNIILDGAGYTVTGSGIGNGTTLTNISNVTVRNLTIKNFTRGIWLGSSSGNTLSDNNVTANNEGGIWVYDSSSNNTLSGNNVTANNIEGINLVFSSNSTVSGNNIANNTFGIYLYSSSGNTLSGNSAANNDYGVEIDYSSGNTLSGNNVTANTYDGIYLNSSSGNTLSGNVMVGNEHNLLVSGSALSDFLQSIDTSNLVDGKPVYYFVNQSNIVVNVDAYPEVGYLGFVNCANVTVQGMNLTSNRQGLLLAYTNDSQITGNNAANNDFGIFLDSSSGNTLSGNNVTANNLNGIDLESSSNNVLSGNNVTNNDEGIWLESSSDNTLSGNNITNSDYGIWLESSSDNFIFHNNFVNNTNQVLIFGVVANIWDNGSVGNYWSDYLTWYPNATETNSSGVWNTPYVIAANNTDHYPLMVPYAVVPEFPSIQATMFFMLLTLLTVIIYKKKGAKTNQSQTEPRENAITNHSPTCGYEL